MKMRMNVIENTKNGCIELGEVCVPEDLLDEISSYAWSFVDACLEVYARHISSSVYLAWFESNEDTQLLGVETDEGILVDLDTQKAYLVNVSFRFKNDDDDVTDDALIPTINCNTNDTQWTYDLKEFIRKDSPWY